MPEQAAASTLDTRRGSDYAELSRRVKRAGLLDRRPAYYGIKIAANVVLLAGGWTAFALLGNSWWQLIVAAYLAVIFTQVAFVGHDAGHRQVFSSRRANDLLGLLHGNLGVGMSYGWWVGKHNRHHSHPNQVERDPDVTMETVAFTPDQARMRRGAIRLLVRYQAYLFFPMLLFEGFQLHVASVRALVSRTVRARSLEPLLLFVHFAAYLAAVFIVLSPLHALAFIAVQQGLFGVYMGCSFAPNHKGMPMPGKDEKLDYLRRQVLTSRNVRGGRIVDFALGGLNYQIEHHLFPSMPRPNLRRSQSLIRAYCRERGLPYTESTVVGSYSEVLRHLHLAGAPLRPVTTE
ncbi:MAG: fatty acid desaturase family protein [Streptosporangiaceae bacterium]